MDRPAENSLKKTVENTERIIDVFQDEIIQLMGIKDFKMFARSGAGLCLSPQEVDDIISSHVGADEQKLQLLLKWHSKHSDATTDDIRRIANKFLCRDSEGTEEVIRKSELEVDHKDSEASGSVKSYDFDSDTSIDANDRFGKSFAQVSGKATDFRDGESIDSAFAVRQFARNEFGNEEVYYDASSGAGGSTEAADQETCMDEVDDTAFQSGRPTRMATEHAPRNMTVSLHNVSQSEIHLSRPDKIQFEYQHHPQHYYSDLSKDVGAVRVPVTVGNSIQDPSGDVQASVAANLVQSSRPTATDLDPPHGIPKHAPSLSIMDVSQSEIAVDQRSFEYHHYTNYYSEHGHPVPTDVFGETTKAVTQECVINKAIVYYQHKRLHQEKPIYRGERKTAEKNEPLAVKLLEYTDTAVKEAGILHKVNGHPNVVLIHDSGRYSDRVFIAMELCSSETLFEYVDSLNDDDFDDVLALRHATQLIEGLSHIHNMGIAHRDLKPHNVLFSLDVDHSRIKIIDFGISKKFDATVTCKTAGTMGYRAPEIVKKLDVEDRKKCDVFSLGVVVYFRLSNGKHPFGDVDYYQDVNIADGKPDLSRILIKEDEKREAIKLIIEKMLEPEEKKRPSSAEILQLWRRSVEN